VTAGLATELLLSALYAISRGKHTLAAKERKEHERATSTNLTAAHGFCRTTELSDAGGPARPHCQLTWPARVRSSDFVRPFRRVL